MCVVVDTGCVITQSADARGGGGGLPGRYILCDQGGDNCGAGPGQGWPTQSCTRKKTRAEAFAAAIGKVYLFWQLRCLSLLFPLSECDSSTPSLAANLSPLRSFSVTESVPL